MATRPHMSLATEMRECPVCLDDMLNKTPKLLECKHSYCMSCLSGLAVAHGRSGLNISCPKCKHNTVVKSGKLSDLPSNFLLGELKAAIEEHLRYPYCFYCNKQGAETRAVSQCMNCRRYLCKDCLDKHQRNPRFSNHEIVTLRNEKEEHCSKHDEPVLYVCMACTPARLICDVCMVLDGQYHAPEELIDYATAVSEIESEIKSHISQDIDVDDEVSKIESKQQTLTQKVQENADTFKKCIETTKNDIVSKITKGFDVESLKIAAENAKESKLKAEELLKKGKKRMDELSEAAVQITITLQKLSEEKERALRVDTYEFHKEEELIGGIDGAYMKFKLFDFPTEIEGSQLPGVQGFSQPLVQYDVKRLLGVNKGIQGHHNSCYLDSTWFCMFSFADVFDEILHRPKGKDDVDEYRDVETVLKERIVNRLRSEFLVPAGQMMLLRDQLDKLSPVQGLRSEEKDPEEFLNCLLNHVMKAEPFVRLSEFLVPAGQMMLLRDQLDKLSPVQGLRSEEKDPEEFLNCLLNHVI